MVPLVPSVFSAPAKLTSLALCPSSWWPRVLCPLTSFLPVPNPICQRPASPSRASSLPWAGQQVVLVSFSESLALLKLETSVSLLMLFFSEILCSSFALW